MGTDMYGADAREAVQIILFNFYKYTLIRRVNVNGNILKGQAKLLSQDKSLKFLHRDSN